MTCAVMLDRMLEADVGELRGQGESAVAAHLRECTRCRTVANRLVRDTSGLADFIRTTSAPVTVRRRHSIAMPARVVAMVGLAAAVAAILVRYTDRPADSSSAKSGLVMQPVMVSPPAAPSIVVAGAARVQTRRASNRLARVPLPTGRPTQPLAVTVEPTVVASVQPAIAVLPVRLNPAPQQPLGNTVAADPPAGKRANIIHTDHPGVTVVWLYE
jgi:hypothetical protein